MDLRLVIQQFRLVALFELKALANLLLELRDFRTEDIAILVVTLDPLPAPQLLDQILSSLQAKLCLGVISVH